MSLRDTHWRPPAYTVLPSSMNPERAALDRILALIRTHGGEDAATNYSLLCSIQKIAKQAIAKG